VAALHGIEIEKGLLQRMQFAILLEAFDRRDLLSGTFGQRGNARTRSLTIDKHRAGPALPFATAVFAAREGQVIPEDAKQAALGISRDFARRAIDEKLGFRRHWGPLSSLWTGVCSATLARCAVRYASSARTSSPLNPADG